MGHFQLQSLRSGLGDGVQRLLQQIHASAPGEGVKIEVPVQVGHVELVELPIFGVQLVPQLLRVVVPEDPLLGREVGDHFEKFFDFFVALDQPEKSGF